MRAPEIVAAIRAKHAGCAILTEVSITDPAWLDRWEPGQAAFGATRRIDILLWRTLQRTAIEVKVSRSDYLRETDNKRAIWREHAHRFVYAAPEGLIRPNEVPSGCGLWEVTPGGQLVVTKRAKVNRDALPLPEHVVQTLAYRAMRQDVASGAA